MLKTLAEFIRGFGMALQQCQRAVFEVGKVQHVAALLGGGVFFMEPAHQFQQGLCLGGRLRGDLLMILRTQQGEVGQCFQFFFNLVDGFFYRGLLMFGQLDIFFLSQLSEFQI